MRNQIGYSSDDNSGTISDEKTLDSDMVIEEDNNDQNLFSEKLQDNSESDEINTSSQNVNKEKLKILFERLCKLLKEEQLFKDVNLTREYLIERLGTNRTYLTQAITENSGKNYSQFINSYRIEQAIKILNDPTKSNYPLKQIRIDIGFGSTTAFYRAFSSIIGIPPSAYRKTLISVRQEQHKSLNDD